jgi:uracil-DNA glycosylase
MDDQGPIAASDMINSLTGWWDLAGVDSVVSDISVDWLSLDAKQEPTTAPLVTAETQQAVTAKPAVGWPEDIEALRIAISDQIALPGNGYGSRPVSSIGPSTCEMMVVSDLPDSDELTAGKLGSGASGVLLERMLTAIGVNLADCYWTSLASTMPATGELPDADIRELAAFLRHQIGLVKPKSIISLGSVASKALIGLDLMEARQNLRDFNHDGGKVAVLTTFHPRTLIARPQMKSQAWRDLQMFAKRDIL